MCKNVVLLPVKKTVDSAMQKTCRPALFGRVWQASRRALSLEHSPPHQFACSQWQIGQRPSTYYLIYRWILFIIVLAIGVASFVSQHIPRNYKGPKIEVNYFKWFIYFTDWGYALIGIQTTLALAVVHKYRKETKCNLSSEEDEHPMSSPKRTPTPFVCRAYWLAQNVATDLAFVITLVYWFLVYDPEMHTLNPVNLLVHGANSIIIICELCVTAHPIRMAHAMYGAGMGLTYGLFSYMYWAAGGTDRIGLPAIYPSLDWNKPGAALGFVSVCAVVLIFAHAISTAIVALRIRLARHLRSTKSSDEKMSLPTF